MVAVLGTGRMPLKTALFYVRPRRTSHRKTPGEVPDMTNRTLSVGMVAAGLVTLLALSGLPAPAQDKSAKAAPAMDAKESPEGEAVKNIALAYDLAALGRKSDSPEMLLAAAKVLGMYKSNPGKDKPKVSGGVDEPTEPLSLSEEAHKLLTEAKEKAKGDKAIIALADAIADGLSRGSYGGPRSYTHQPRSGATLTWNVNFIPGQMASLFYTTFRLAPGPKMFQAMLRSCIRCKPNHRVCVPGGSAFLRFT